MSKSKKEGFTSGFINIPTLIFIGVVVLWGGAWLIWGERKGQGATGETLDRYTAPVDLKDGACDNVQGTPDERLDACLNQLPPFDFSKAATREVDSIGANGKVLVIGDAIRGSFEQSGLVGDKTLRDLLMAKDEEAVAKTLLESGYRGAVVHRDITGALDRDNVVLSRLAHHDFLEWFQLRYVENDAYIYTVRRSKARISLTTGEQLLKGLRARLSMEPAAPQEWNPKSVRLIGTARLQGATLAMRHAAGSNIERVLDDLAGKLKKRWSREVATEGHGLLKDRLQDIRLEVHVVMERAPVRPRSPRDIFEIWEMGVDGMMFSHAEGVENQKFTYMPGSELIIRSMKSTEQMFKYATKMFGWRDSSPWRDGNTRLYIIRDQHFAESRLGGGPAMRMFRGMPEEPMEGLTDAKIRDMLVDGGEWWLANMQADGSFNYKFWPSQNRLSSDYNEVRHILATRDLADTWRYRQDERYLDGSRKAMDWLLKYQIHDTDKPHSVLPHPTEGSMLFRYPLVRGEVANKPPNQKLGTVAVALLGWVAWAEATGSRAEDERIRKMAQFVLSQADSDGKFHAYYVDQNHAYYNNKNDIVPGEAALALGEVAEYFDEPQWLEFFPKFLDYYEPWFRSRAAKKNPYGRWPHHTYDNLVRLDLVQFGPWSVMANKQYYSMTGDERAAAFGLEVADWMIDNYQWSEERSPWPDFIGGYYKIPSELPAMQTFCYSEGTAAAYQVASKFRPKEKDKYDISTREAIRFLRVMQFDERDSYFAADPDLIHGGIKYAMNEQKIRIDYVGHGLSTLSQYLDAKAYDPAATLEVEPVKVSYADQHKQMWGEWQLSKLMLRNQAEMTASQKEAMQKQFERFAKLSRFHVSPDLLVQSISGRRQQWNYSVIEDRGSELVAEVESEGGQKRIWQMAMVGEEMTIFDGRVERTYQRLPSNPSN